MNAAPELVSTASEQSLPDRASRILRNAAVLIAIAACLACAEGAGDGGPITRSISGGASLGIIRGADVVVHSPTEIIGEGTTDDMGRFGPISLPDRYSGPVRVTISPPPGGGATWICDFEPGCPDDFGGIVAFGEVLDFDTQIEAVLPRARPYTRVHVSLLSHIAARYAETLGPLSASNVTLANGAVRELIRDALSGAAARLAMTEIERFPSLLLPDLNSLDTEDGTASPTATALALLNASLIGLMPVGPSLEEFAEDLGGVLLSQGSLPAGSPPSVTLSRASLLAAFIRQLSDIRSENDATADGLLDPLSPVALVEIELDAISNLGRIPRLGATDPFEARRPVVFREADAAEGIERLIEIEVSTGSVLDPERLTTTVDADWVDAEITNIDDRVYLRLDYLADALTRLGNGIYTTPLRISSLDGTFIPYDQQIEVLVYLRPR